MGRHFSRPRDDDDGALREMCRFMRRRPRCPPDSCALASWLATNRDSRIELALFIGGKNVVRAGKLSRLHIRTQILYRVIEREIQLIRIRARAQVRARGKNISRAS